MYLRRKLESKVSDQQKRISDLERQIAEARAYLNGLQDSLKLLPVDGIGSPKQELRAGSDLAKARDILQAEGKPMHVDEILKRIGKDVTRNSKSGLGASMGSYVRKGIIFTKSGPNVFGLVEFEAQQVSQEPPTDFGVPRA